MTDELFTDENGAGEGEDNLLDLSDIAPPRQRVRPPSGGPIVTLASPREFGVRDQTRLNNLQKEIRKFERRDGLTPEQSDQLSNVYRKVTKMVLRDVDEDDFAQLTDDDMQALVLVFTGRWADYMKRLIDEIGEEQVMAMFNRASPISES